MLGGDNQYENLARIQTAAMMWIASVVDCRLPGGCRLIHHVVHNWCVWRQNHGSRGCSVTLFTPIGHNMVYLATPLDLQVGMGNARRSLMADVMADVVADGAAEVKGAQPVT